MALTRKYVIEAMSNGYSIQILEESGVDGPIAWRTVEQYVAGGTRAGTKPETFRKRVIGYALGELKEQLEKAIEEADNARPELGLPAEELDPEPTLDEPA